MIYNDQKAALSNVTHEFTRLPYLIINYDLMDYLEILFLGL